MHSTSDAELVLRARQADREAFSELIRRYQRPIYALACTLLRDRHEAEDLAQEAFLRAWLNLDMLSDPAKFSPWLGDQLILLRMLDWLGRQQLLVTKISLICLGQYPGIENFVGLGQLNSDQLSSLADTRQSVTAAQLRLAQAGWSAFTSPDPTEIERLLISDTSALPFLEKALLRHLEQFPSVQNGLSRTEHQALEVLHQHGPVSALRLFAVQRAEEPLFMGDLSFFWLLLGLACAKHPLVQTTDASGLRLSEYGPAIEKWANSPVTLTDAGRQVLEGRTDYIQLNGIDRWVGGVHLQGSEARWRWDREASRLVALESPSKSSREL